MTGAVRRDRHRHDAVFHGSGEELAAAVLPFVQQGLQDGDRVLLAVAPETAALCREAVAADPRVSLLDRDDLYLRRTPGVLSELRRLTAEQVGDGDGRLRLVAEPVPARTPREWLDRHRLDTVVNVALAGAPLWALCVFDTRALPPDVVTRAWTCHPHVVGPAGRTDNPRNRPPAEVLRSLPVPPEPLEATAPVLAVEDAHDFIGLRHAVSAQLRQHVADRDLLEDFLLAVDEMTSNAVRHGRPPVGLRLWAAEDRVVCAISDSGSGPEDPYAGFGPAHGPDLSAGGMGLWLARELCDHVDVVHEPGRVTVRLTALLR